MTENLVGVVDRKLLDMGNSEGEHFHEDSNSHQAVGNIQENVEEDSPIVVEYLAVESFDSG